MSFLNNKKYRLLKIISKYSFVLILGFSVLMPVTGQGAGTGSGGISFSTGIKNPLPVDDIPSFINIVINSVLVIGIPIVALAIIYTGFLFVQARGNPEEITKAKKALLYTLIGAALLLGAFVIAQAIKATVDDIKSGI